MSLSRIRTRLLVPVWGSRYVELFCAIGLAALLSDGNLPALARETDCEVIFLTTASSIDDFKCHSTYHRLREICAVSFVAIDDIVDLGSYGVTLTLAYARGIRSLGSRQIGTYYVFLNADFVLSQNALSVMLGYIRRNYGVVLAPTLRCKDEDVRPILSHLAGSGDNLLDISSRDLVDMALRHLHPTALASIVNQPMFHHAAVNQFLWRVDQNTLIGRFYLLFMLCIRVDRIIEIPSGFCDYTFVPDLCPLGMRATIKDSDELFIAELQAVRGESHFLRFGQVSPEDYAAHLSTWSTREHRAYAEDTLLFHAASLPRATDDVCREADAFMRKIKLALRPEPMSHQSHPHWVGALREIRIGCGSLPAELEGDLPQPAVGSGWTARLVKTLYRSPLNPFWVEHRLLKALVKRMPVSAGQRGLYVANWEPKGFPSPQARASIMRHASTGDVMKGGLRASEKFDFCLVYFVGSGRARLADLLGAVAAYLRPGASVYCFLDGTEVMEIYENLPLKIAMSLPYGMTIQNFQATGNKTRILLRRITANWYIKYRQAAGLRRLWPAPFLLGLIATTGVVNLVTAAFTSRRRRQFCTSIAFECTLGNASADEPVIGTADSRA